MFIYQKKESTAIVNYVSRFYTNSAYEDDNIIFTGDLNRQTWEGKGFVVVSEHNGVNKDTVERSSQTTRSEKSLRHTKSDGKYAKSSGLPLQGNERHVPVNGLLFEDSRRIDYHLPYPSPMKHALTRGMVPLSGSGISLPESLNARISTSLSSIPYAYRVSEFHPDDQDVTLEAVDIMKDEVNSTMSHRDGVSGRVERLPLPDSNYYWMQEVPTVSGNISGSTGFHDAQKKSLQSTSDEMNCENTERSKTLPEPNGFRFWYAKFLVRFPVSFCVLLFVLTVAAGAVSFLLNDLPSFDDPLKGFESRHTLISDRTAGLELFFSHQDDPNFHVASHHGIASNRSATGAPNETLPTSPPDNSGSINTSPPASNDSSLLSCVPQVSLSRNLRIVFSRLRSGDELFTADAFHSMCSLYDQHVNDSSLLSTVAQNCEPVSLGQITAAIKDKPSCFDVTAGDVDDLKALLRRCAPHYSDRSLSYDCSPVSCPTVPRECLQTNAVFNIFHYLLPSESASVIAHGDFLLPFTLMITPISGYSDLTKTLILNNIQGHDLRDNVTQIRAVGSQLKFDLLSNYLVTDMKFIAFGVGLIVCIIWLYTGSFFVTIMTIIDIAMSLVVSYFLYVMVIGLPFFPFLNVLASVLLLGIGADDTFVYIDIWRSLRKRHGKKEELMVVVLHETLRHASVTMFVTSFTTSSALFFSVTSSITTIKCFSVYAGCAVLVNFLFTVTWLPAIVIIEAKYFEKCCRRETPKSQITVFRKIQKRVKTAARFIFEEMIPKLVFKLSYLWIVLFILIGVGGGCAIFVYPKLNLPSHPEFQVFVSSDYLEQYDQVFKPVFDFERVAQNKMPIMFLWGVKPKDNGNQWDPNDRGYLVLDDSFNISAPQSQEWLLQFCSSIRNQSFYSEEDTTNDFCFIDLLKSMMEGPCFSPVVGADVFPCCNQHEFPYDSALFEQCSAVLLSQRNLEQAARFGEDDKLKGLLLSFTSTTGYSLVYASIDNFYSTVDNWGQETMNEAPESLAGGWFASFTENQLFYFDLQHSLVTGTPFSIGMSLGVAALVLLLTTWNILITLYAMLSIAGTVFVTIGTLVFMGWELNIVESTVMTLAVGLSVDFTIHYGVAYRIAPAGDRISRSTYAVKQLTSAISTAALSTFVAGACMLPATVLSYQQIGVFLMLVMTVSLAYSTLFFMSLCRVIGPENNCLQGNLMLLLACSVKPIFQMEDYRPTYQRQRKSWM
ncbi:protein dispatched homolog 1-like [Diadema antillarum]|uniref:protein dispatched homolog 1-like n=1 Tax=Diadema antillarum TaxID=105358 RepID=UPI003A8915A7